MNQDIRYKKTTEITTTLPLMEAFDTIQGEGYHCGKAAYFIRLGGCDVGCHWCDVKESWDADTHTYLSIREIVDQVPKKRDLVVITGGEPLMWKLDELTKQLAKRGKKIHLETSGAYAVSGRWDWFCLSPKKRKLPVKEAYPMANELKVIVYNNSDFKFAADESQKVSAECKLLLQPEWSRRHKVMPKIVDFVKKYPRWVISLQTHKYLNVP